MNLLAARWHRENAAIVNSRKITATSREEMDMRSVNAEELGIKPILPSLKQVDQSDIAIAPETPEVPEVGLPSFKMEGKHVHVSLQTMSGKPIQFTIGYDKFLLGITAAVAFMNMNLSALWDMIGI